MSECLFIGGSSDGDFIEVDLSLDYIAMPYYEYKNHQPISPGYIKKNLTFNVEVYKRHELRERGRSIFVYVHTELKYDSLMGLLVSGYRKPNKVEKA